MKKDKIVCILRNGYYPQCVRITKEAKTLSDFGYNVHVICLKDKNQKYIESINNIKIYRIPIPYKRITMLGYVLQYCTSTLIMGIIVTLLYARYKYNCIQINTMPDFLVFSTIIPRMLGSKIIIDMHEPIPELYETKYNLNGKSILLKILIKLEQISINYAHTVITVNNSVCKRYVERGANINKIRIIRNVPYENSLILNIKSKKSKTFNIISHGTIEERNGYDVVVRALAILKNEINNIRFIILGRGNDINKVLTIANKMNCADIINYYGFVPESQIGKWIIKSNVGVVPLLDTPFGQLCQPIKMFEYAMYKKPIIVPNLGAIKEIFCNDSVLYYKPGNHIDLAYKILYLYNNPQEAVTLSEKSFMQYEKYRWYYARHDYVKLIDNVCNNIKKIY